MSGTSNKESDLTIFFVFNPFIGNLFSSRISGRGGREWKILCARSSKGGLMEEERAIKRAGPAKGGEGRASMPGRSKSLPGAPFAA